MNLFKWIAQLRVSTTQKQSELESSSSFLLEPILTPSAGIDGTEGLPELALPTV